MSVNVEATLGDLVTEDIRRSRVLERHGLDYCCNGHRTLADASAEAGLDAEAIAVELDLADAPAASAAMPRENAALAHDIVDTHHAYMWEEMPRLKELVDKVARVHGGNHAELLEVQQVFTTALGELEPHMTTEERVVFPAISRIEKSGAPNPGGSLVEPIAQLRREHDAVGDLFKKIRSLTGGYAVPGDACGSYTAMLKGLEEMELDLHEHIHKENNVLFPRALELEQQVSG